MALEPSEVFCAAALCFSNTKLKKLQGSGGPNDRIDKFLIFFLEAEKVASSGKVVFAENKQAFLNFFKDPLKNPGNIIDMSRGISAAIAVQDWMQSKHKVTNPTADRVFMTGNVWPDEVKPLAVKAHGFDAYNSSDLIIRPVRMKNAYFGVSLKKKPKPNDQDPTLINKAFDTVLTDKSFDIVKKELEDIREKYFAGLVKEAVKEGYINLDITGKTDAQLFKPDKRTRNSEGFERIYIDTKGSMKMPEIYGPKDTNIRAKWGTAKESRFEYYGDKALGRSELSSRNDTMRAWVNKKLGEPSCPLYKAFLKVMNDNSEVFAKNLINVTLKTDLPNQMKAKNLGNMTFGFALVSIFLMQEYITFFLAATFLHLLMLFFAFIDLKVSWHSAVWSFILGTGLMIHYNYQFSDFGYLFEIASITILVGVIRWKANAHTLLQLVMGLAIGFLASTPILFI